MSITELAWFELPVGNCKVMFCVVLPVGYCKVMFCVVLPAGYCEVMFCVVLPVGYCEVAFLCTYGFSLVPKLPRNVNIYRVYMPAQLQCSRSGAWE